MVLRNYWYQIRLHSRAARSMYHGAKIRLPTPQYLHSAVSPRPLPPGLAHEEPQQPRLPRSGQSLRRRLFLGPEAVWSRPGRPRNRLAQPLSVRRHFAPAPPIVLHMGVGTCLHALQQEYFPAHKLYGRLTHPTAKLCHQDGLPGLHPVQPGACGFGRPGRSFSPCGHRCADQLKNSLGF